jgi:hypothetical protein
MSGSRRGSRPATIGNDLRAQELPDAIASDPGGKRPQPISVELPYSGFMHLSGSRPEGTSAADRGATMIRKQAPSVLALTLATLTLAALMLAAVTASAAGVTPAAATPPRAGATATKAKTKLTLGVTAEAGWARAVLLLCSPPGGGHPKPAKACAALKAARGKPAKLTPTAVMCTLQYAPVTASVTGTWKGRKVTWSRTFGNECELVRATGVVFRF